ncbi:MAG: hypothetical protein ACFB21_07860 [Opitutales bacterium]
MGRLLQVIGFKTNRYDRPNRKWICGNEGIPCQECLIGPDKHGRCRATRQCKPVKKGDRYQCARVPSLGGKCEEGPLPDGRCCNEITRCTPVRSLRSQRGRLCAVLGFLTITFVVLSFFGSQREEIVNPGALSLAHATSAQSCQDCHALGDTDLIQTAGFAMLDHLAIASSQKCTDCHEVSETGHALSPHGLDPETLAQLTANQQGTSAASDPGIIDEQAALLLAHLGDDPARLACASCHTEHKGRHADLRAMGEAQCQACHSTRFESFAQGHPDFHNYPYERRTRIIFDHISHLDTHFASSEFRDRAPQSCQTCHETDRKGQLMLTRSFEQTCASCHGDQIKGAGRAGAQGLAVFRIPALDAETLQSKGRGIGDWPEYAEGEITPFMRLLLQRHPEAVTALETLEGLELYDLRDASEAELAAAEQFGWAVKGLFYDLIHEGQNLLANPAQVPPDPALVAGLSHDTLINAQEAWMPNLHEEVAAYRRGEWQPEPTEETSSIGLEEAEESQTSDDTSNALAGGEALLSGSEINDGGDLLGRSSNAGDDLLGGSGGNEEADLLGGPDSGSGDDLLGSTSGGDGDLLGGTDTGNEGDLLGGSDSDEGEDLLGGSSSGSDDLLGGTDTSGGDDLLGGGDADEPDDLLLTDGESGGDDLLSGAGPLSTGSEGSSSQDADERSPRSPRGTVYDELPDPEAFVAHGGWYRNDFAYTISYRPLGHSDAFLKHWLDLSALLAAEDGVAEAIFARLSDPKAPGLCMKCHAVDQAPADSLQVNWTGSQTHPFQHKFTRFDHAAHFSLMDDKGCLTCHSLDRSHDYAQSFDDRNPHTFTSNFDPLDRATCVQCHNSQVAGSDCLQCHNYHVGLFRPVLQQENLKALETVRQAPLAATPDADFP